MLLLTGRSFAFEELKIRFEGMNPHVGQKFELRVVNTATQQEAGRTALAAIINHDFDVELEVIDIGQSYLIDFYADLNQNGRYDAPPADHAWRLELNNVLGDTTLTFVHNTNFTDIEWPTGVTSVSENRLADNLPTEFALLQNYPNPFNPTTTIKFDLPDNSKIKLSIYNSLGQLVRVLVDKELPAGHHQAVWDGRDFNGSVLASGLYFYQIKADKFVKTTRMILMK